MNLQKNFCFICYKNHKSYKKVNKIDFKVSVKNYNIMTERNEREGNMGTNYYFDQGEGDDIMGNYPHIGKYIRGSFIFYKSRSHQLGKLFLTDSRENIINEYGERQTVESFLEYIVNLPYTEQDFEFF